MLNFISEILAAVVTRDELRDPPWPAETLSISSTRLNTSIKELSAGVTHGFLMSGDEFTSIDFPGASFTVAFGINSRGDIVGYYMTDGMNHGFLLSREGEDDGQNNDGGHDDGGR